MTKKVDCTILSKNVAGRAWEAVSRCGAHRPAGGADAASLYAVSGARKYLNAAERRQAVAAANDLESDQALFVLTLAGTGARVSELLALSASSFQLERGLVALKTLKRRRHSVREVPLCPTLLQALDQHFRLAEAQRDPNLATRRLWPWCRQTGWRIIKRVMVRSGIVGIAASPRGLRHGFGVGTLQAGVPLNLTQRWLGHSRMSTTAIYADACGEEEIAFAERFWKLDRYERAPAASASGGVPS